MPMWVQAEELNIQHMGYPCQGMPVRFMTGGECPSDAFHRETMLNMTVIGYILGIIVANEVTTIDLPKRQDGSNNQEDADHWNLMVRHRAFSPSCLAELKEPLG